MEIKFLGRIDRKHSDRVCGLDFYGEYFLCYGKGSKIDMFMVLSEEKLAKKIKKAKKRGR